MVTALQALAYTAISQVITATFTPTNDTHLDRLLEQAYGTIRGLEAVDTSLFTEIQGNFIGDVYVSSALVRNRCPCFFSKLSDNFRFKSTCPDIFGSALKSGVRFFPRPI